jgi:hypothetical protein
VNVGTNGVLNFDITVERCDDGGFVARSESPFGGASTRFRLPFSDLELQNLSLRVGRGSSRFRALDSETNVALDVGSRLYGEVFAGEVANCFQRTLDLADQDEGALRIRLKLTDVPELTNLPWEFLYSPRLRRFLALSLKTQVVRYLEAEGRIRPLRVAPPLRVLVAMSSPPTYPALDIDHEWALLKAAVTHLESDGRLVMQRLDKPTLPCLQEALRRNDYNVFHFIGHGGYSERHGGGVVLLENEDGHGVVTRAARLATVLHDERSLRLAILNSCEGARAGDDDVFSGTAQTLVHAGIPAVIGMQNEISDEAAVIFAQQFYGAIADGCAVDQAIGEARKGMYARQEDDEFEWGTPVLYLRATDGQIFDLTKTVENHLRSPAEPPAQIAAALDPTPARPPPPPPPAGRATDPPTTTYCRRCGTQRIGTSPFCRRCGAQH